MQMTGLEEALKIIAFFYNGIFAANPNYSETAGQAELSAIAVQIFWCCNSLDSKFSCMFSCSVLPTYFKSLSNVQLLSLTEVKFKFT